MALPTYNDLIPGAVVVDELADLPTTVVTTEPALIIPWSFFLAQGLDVPANLLDPEKMMTCLLKSMQTWYASDNTEQPALEFDPIRISRTDNRNGNPADSFAFGITVYQSTSRATLDPDSIKSGL